MNTPLRVAISLLLIGGVGASLQADTKPRQDLDWIAGHWCREQGTEFIEEHWLPARGGLLLGLGRTVVAGEARAFEFLRIEVREGKVTFVAQPNGMPPTPFALTASGAGWVRFENPAHDFPKRVEYRRTPQGLHAEIAGPGDGGRDTVIPFDYRPCGAGNP